MCEDRVVGKILVFLKIRMRVMWLSYKIFIQFMGIWIYLWFFIVVIKCLEQYLIYKWVLE